MPGPAATAAERAPRRARYLIPPDTPRRGEIVAAFGVAILLAHLLFAQLTTVLAIALTAVDRISRWRPQWLAVPAGVGLIWALAIGPAAALAGLTAGPRQVWAYLGSIVGNPGRLLHLSAAFTGIGQWLPRQLPLALVLAAAEAAAVRWLSWLHTDADAAAPPRPGLIVAARRRYAAAAIRSGGVVTRDGGALGIDQAAGRQAAISWRAAEGGVLAAGGPGPGPAATGFQLVHAAIRRRKPVIAVDLTGSSWLAGSLAAVCGAAGAPFYQFGEAGQASYEPLRGGDPARGASLLLGMIDWAGTAGRYRRAATGYLGDVFAVLAAAPGDPREPVLDDVVRLLSPAALRARLDRVPAYHPHRSALAGRVAASASLAEADPATLLAVAGQLTALRSAPIGRWLGPAGQRISLGQVVRERAVGLFALGNGTHDPAATMVAGLIAFDAMALFAELRGIPASGDGVAWFNGCETLDQPALAELVARGGRAGMTVLFSTTSERAAASLAGEVNVLAIHQLADPEAAGQLAARSGAGTAGGGPGRAVQPAAAGPAASAEPGGAVSPAASAVPGKPVSAGPAAVPDWARRMTVPAAAGSSAAAGAGAAAPAPAARHPFGRKGSPVVTADSLLRLHEGAFTLVMRSPERQVLPLCQAVHARIPGRPA
jgi:hypothetical protein